MGSNGDGPQDKESGSEKQWDSVLEALFKVLTTGKEAIKTKEAVEVGTKSIEYFRGQDLPKWIAKHKKLLITKCSAALHLCTGEEAAFNAMPPAEIATKIGNKLIHEGFILRAEHRPVGSVMEAPEELVEKEDNATQAHFAGDNPKWPRRVGITKNNQSFDEAGFYVILYEPDNSWNHVLLACIILGILLACLFPIWPFRLKIGAWYIGVALMTLMIIIIILRLVLFMALWFCGCDFWFLPNFFDEEAGVLDSFVPLYSFERRKDDWLMFGARIFAALLCVGGFYKLSETHSLSDIGANASRGFLDILDWGHQKLADAPANPETVDTEKTASLSPEELQRQQWNTCVGHCEFQDYEEFKDFCLSDCECLAELWGSNCWKRCEQNMQDELKKIMENCNAGIPPQMQDAEDEEDQDGKTQAEDNEEEPNPEPVNEEL